MKTATLSKLFFITAFTGILFSCKKSSVSSSSTETSTQVATSADDVTRTSTESDAAFDDVNTAMVAQTSVTGASIITPILRSGIQALGGPGNADTVETGICDAVVTLDTVDNPHTITITYNGTNCALNRTRTGSVVISFAAGTIWRNAGSTVTVTFNNLAITRLIDNTTITLNGTHTYTNVSGGSIISLPNEPGDSVVHTITSSNMSITFDNGSKSTWSVARRRVFSSSGGYLVITQTGTHTSGTTTGISMWGDDRYGNAFTVDILSPYVLSQGCSWQMTSGEVQLTLPNVTSTMTLGLNASGVATGCPVSGSYYYFDLSATFTASGKTYSVLMPY
jgi:hypothetical protein